MIRGCTASSNRFHENLGHLSAYARLLDPLRIPRVADLRLAQARCIFRMQLSEPTVLVSTSLVVRETAGQIATREHCAFGFVEGYKMQTASGHPPSRARSTFKPFEFLGSKCEVLASTMDSSFDTPWLKSSSRFPRIYQPAGHSSSWNSKLASKCKQSVLAMQSF